MISIKFSFQDLRMRTFDDVYSLDDDTYSKNKK